MKKKMIIESIVMLFTILFLYTGISKIIEYSIFKEQIATSPILAPIATPVAFTLPWIEFLATVLLVIPRWRFKGFIVSLSLMVLFTMYTILILNINENIPCSCGGLIGELSWQGHIALNTAFIALAITGIVFEKQLKSAHRLELSSINDQKAPIQA
ncbi:MauE/DoxX family redox-associated membrane protein [Niastella populi]|uniref:Methylamine utilisation protein MauE domain-containing protein n=1 Tax=Niastella populi TaxID=550983 RepID=A0A1V9G7L6_9BACT|nr:MauE/DoxX family redox-associated membrane protein [Niastella populi]OQP66625.1 hypothetical protein A4R26_12625 [Niastella populi]